MAFKRFVFLFLLVVSSMFLRVEIACGQVYSLQTNVLGWGTTNMNLEFGLKFSHRWTFHFPLQYNPFSFGDARLRNLSASPGIRYWVREAYGRSYFFGIQGVGAMYNVGGVFGGKYRYEGYGFGGGLSLGYNRPLSPHWNLEFEAGLGVLWTHNDKYVCKTCGQKVATLEGVRLVPTKLAVNIVYLF